MTKRMLVDATHDEETRVAVMDGDRLDEFDYESKYRKPLKGSIFLAKVTRVEPSLQAAFVNFGGNRHGFLPFSEIHPDYFRIPIADREALMAEQQAEIEASEREEEEMDAAVRAEEEREATKGKGNAAADDQDQGENVEILDVDGTPIDETDGDQEDDAEDDVDGNVRGPDPDDDADAGQENLDASDDGSDSKNNRSRGGRGRGGRGRNNSGGGRGRRSYRGRRNERYDNEDRETRFRFNLRRKYKIQEVIKRGQIMLIQVSKEERGNKGAAVSSYLSLPGRYCVLMPNSPRAGGVSRKIANYKDRARMRELMKELEIPQGMSVILRTAGVSRTKTEVKRDLDYLMRLWNNIRGGTLESSAPSMIYEEANLIKRAVRDLYTRDVEEIVVAGAEGYKTAKEFMKMMIPSHSKRVKEYKSDVPLFNKYKAEAQISEIGETQVTLPSGGYLVINPTEALVSVDVNSGKATKERHIEETALKTNLEAATEVARQLRLRDLGGLVVIDFIDMEDRRNNGKVERRMRDALSGDRARIQVGRISMFGLMELSRQRMNPSLTESQYEMCSHCNGMGRVRSCDATSLIVLRAIEDEGAKARAAQVMVHVSHDVALFILNKKRNNLSEIEKRYNFEVLIRADDSMGAAGFRVEVARPVRKGGDDENDQEESSQDDDENKKSSNNRRGRRGGRGRGGQNARGRGPRRDGNSENAQVESNESAEVDSNAAPQNSEEKDDKKPVRGRKPRSRNSSPKEEVEVKPVEKASKSEEKEEKPKRGRKPSAAKTSEKKSEKEAPEDAAKAKKSAKKPLKKDAADNSEKEEKSKKKSASAKSDPSNDDKPEKPDYEVVNEAPTKKKKGWWSRGSD